MSGLQKGRLFLFDLKYFGGIFMKTNDQRNWIIYMYTFPNGKRYIGKTSTSLSDRQGGAKWSGYKNCTVLMKAVKKYGIENIKQEILFEGKITDEYSSRLEQIFILLFKTNCRRFKNPQYGYNTTDGGEGTVGHHHTEESKRKMSESKKGKRTGSDSPNAKPVYCIELDATFVSAADAEKHSGVSRKTISLCCLRKNKSTGGGNTMFKTLHWVFESDKSDEIIYEIVHQPAVKFPINTSSGVHGVYWDRSKNKWAAQFAYNGHRVFLGRYVKKHDAIVARLSAENRYRGSAAPQFYLFDKYNIK
jgi:hypothetical protein